MGAGTISESESSLSTACGAISESPGRRKPHGSDSGGSRSPRGAEAYIYIFYL